MRNYETVVILKPQLSDKEIADFIENAKKAVSSNGGEVLSEEKLGRKRLAHDIKKEKEGFFLLLKFKSETPFLAKFDKDLKLNENVLRHTILKSEEVSNK